MKTLKFLSVLVISATMFMACEKEETDSVLNSPVTQEIKLAKNKEQAIKDKAACNINCPIGKCEASGSVAQCSCVLGLFAKCSSGGSTQVPTQDGDQSNESGNLVNFIDDNLTPSSVATNLSSTVNSIQNAIDSDDDVAYENGLSDFEIQMNNLSISNKEAMNEYAESINIDPIFEF